jgi:hypothetical protein
LPLKGLFISTFSLVILFLLVDHARIHNGKLASVKDFQNALHNIVKSHEGLIVAVALFTVGALTGLLLGAS